MILIKNLFSLLFATALFISCNSKYNSAESDDIIAQSKIDMQLAKAAAPAISNGGTEIALSIKSAFDSWKISEIKAGKMCASMEQYRKEMQQWEEEEVADSTAQPIIEEIKTYKKINPYYEDGERFMVSNIATTLYADFNEDGIDDGLVVYDREDCMNGAGYVGDWEKAVLFLSSSNGYKVSNKIITDAVKEINKNATGYFVQNGVGYIKFRTAGPSTIGGYYFDWQKGDPSGNPSYKVSFNYNFKTRKIAFSKG